VGLKRGDIAVLILSPGGTFERHGTLGELAQERKGKAKDDFQEALVGKVVVVDARLGGLKDGLLASGSDDIAKVADFFPDGGEEEARRWSTQAGFRVRQAETLPDGEQDGWRFEHSFALRRDDEGTAQEWLVVEHLEDAAQSENARAISKPQELAAHEDLARRKMQRIAQSIGGLPDDAVKALAIGARLHDEGKRTPRWQRAFKAPRQKDENGEFKVYAKTRGPIDQAILAGYRHELGSLLQLEGVSGAYKENVELLRDFRKLPEEWRDLALHLVAAHHGGARPTIETRGCEAGPPSQLEERAQAVALRFARLQRRWGPWGLAWWEALLRAADQQASRGNNGVEDGDPGTPHCATSAPATAEG
jgi:CRISPR-associated endonuclease/helicase Cas3